MKTKTFLTLILGLGASMSASANTLLQCKVDGLESISVSLPSSDSSTVPVEYAYGRYLSKAVGSYFASGNHTRLGAFYVTHIEAPLEGVGGPFVAKLHLKYDLFEESGGLDSTTLTKIWPDGTQTTDHVECVYSQIPAVETF